MSALPWIGAALGVGVVYYLYKKSTTPPAEDDFCAKACKAAGVFCIDGGASCRAGAGVLNQFDGGAGYRDEVKRRQTANDALNGPRDITTSEGPPDTERTFGVIKDEPGAWLPPLAGEVLRYQSGCVPFEYSPGFSKCKPGTFDMYASAVDAASGKVLQETERNLVEPGAFISIAEKARNAGRMWGHINKDHTMTGASGDPTTQGPWGTDSAPWWFVRGVKVTGTSSMAPRAVVLQHFNFNGDRDATIMNLSDAAARELVAIDVDPAIIHTTITSTCGVPTPGYSWVTDHWQRTPAGGTDVPMPCPTSQPSPLVATAHFIGI